MAGFFSELCGVDKVIIGGVHLLALPGTPDYDADGGVEKIYRRAREDVLRLQDAGVDAILFANEADTPYQTRVGPEVVAAMTYCIGRLKDELAVPFGINMLLDPLSGIAVAHATGGKFVRGYYTGGYVGDMGIMNTCGPEAARLRRTLGAADVKFIANLTCAFGVPLAARDLAATAYGAVVHGRVDALAVSGPAARFAADREALVEVRQAVPGVPVLVGTGVTIENVRAMLSVADGAIVASGMKVDGVTLNPVDGERAKRFMAAVRAYREEVGAEGRAS